MTCTLIRNPSSAPLTLPYPFRGVIPPCGAIPIQLSIAQVRSALGDALSQVELKEVPGAGSIFAMGFYSQVIPEPGATWLITLNDANQMIRCTNADGCSLTFPSGLPFDIGITTITIVQAAAGQATLVAGAGTMLNTSQTLLTAKQFAAIVALYVGQDTWDVYGERQAAP